MSIIFLYLVQLLFTITAIHLFYQPNVAIETKGNVIFYYKRNRTFKYNINEIKKVQINTSYGSFDTIIYTIDGRKKSFHFLIRYSNKKKAEYIKYFEDKKIKVIKIDY